MKLVGLPLDLHEVPESAGLVYQSIVPINLRPARVAFKGGGGWVKLNSRLRHINQGIYRYFLFPFKKSEMKIGKATYSLFSIDNLQTKIVKGLKLPFTHFRFNIVK